MKRKLTTFDLVEMSERRIEKAKYNLEQAIDLLGIAISEFKRTKEEMSDIIEIKELTPTYFEKEKLARNTKK